MIKPSDLIPIKTVSELMTAATDRLRATAFRITNLRPGGVFYTLLEICNQALADLHQLLSDISPQLYLETATGEWLDLKAADYNVLRNPAVKTKGDVILIREGTDGNLIIPAGTEVATAVGVDGRRLKYIVADQAVIPTGQSQAPVSVEAEFEGAEYNVGTGMITELLIHINGIIQVTNNSDWITREGCDEEDDDSLRERAQEAWAGLASGGTPEAYRVWARQVPGVMVVWVDDSQPRGQGSVDIYITSSTGAPTPGLISDVQALIDTKRPICANALVKGPELVYVNFDVLLMVDSGDTTMIRNKAAEIIDLTFAYSDTKHPEIHKAGLGFGLTRAQVIANLMLIDGVVGVTLYSPGDIFINNSQLLVKGNVSIVIEVIS